MKITFIRNKGQNIIEHILVVTAVVVVVIALFNRSGFKTAVSTLVAQPGQMITDIPR